MMNEENHNLAKWLEGEMTNDERVAFEKTPEFATYQKIAQYSQNLKSPNFDENAMLKNIISQPKKPVVKLKINWALRIAAVLVIALGIALSWNIGSITKIADSGQKSEFQLPDASEVVLNSGSEIHYKKWNWDNHRSLNLKGEAYFKVAKGKTFDVKTSLGIVSVVGTQFNVKTQNNRFEVVCFEGKVRVQKNASTILITKGQGVTFENGKQKMFSVTTQQPSWISDELVFDSQSLKAVITEIERHYGVSVEIKNSNSNKNFTGTIPANDLAVALKIISKTFGLNMTKTSNSEIIFEGE